MQKVYCEQSLVDLLLLEEDNTIYKIIEKFYDVVTDLETEEILELIKDNPVIKHFIKRDSGSLYGDSSAFAKINDQNYTPFLNDILILPDDIDVKSIRSEYGILALHLEDSFPDEQDFHFGYSLFADEDCPFKNWESIFSTRSLLPVNSAVLIDNFLWKDFFDFSRENGENLYPIMESIIPKELKIPFKLTIVVQNKNGRFTPRNIPEKIKKIEKNLKIRTKVDVQVGVVTQTDTKIFHERVLLTNYHYIYSDKGFSIFKNGRITEYTKGDRNWVFLNIHNYKGEIRKHQHKKNINYLKRAIKDIERSNTEIIFTAGNLDNPLLNQF
ncbi:MAG: hypothetical protein ABJ092_14290 [Gillisia sp.]